ncbi:MAG: DUF475 domain-containing protein [Methylococcaceae bacterium]|nr:DUF475 domain-containing protein [Methylococcaceae bacterium]
MRHFYSSIVIALLGLSAAFYWAGPNGLVMVSILGIMEVSLSFDNAVVNATVLKHMNKIWQRRFLTWGMVIAVFGVRFLLPVLIVSVVTGQSFQSVTLMALQNPEEYARHVQASHVQISAFGGVYLLLVFLSFFFEENKSLHWLGWIERRLARLGKLESIEVATALGTLLLAQYFLPGGQKLAALISGVIGVILYVLVKSLSELFEDSGQTEKTAHHAGFLSFLYLEMLDLSFSLDGVIGAFAITRDVVIILLGLTIGAMFVRSLTLFLVRQKMLEEYLYLEHGAHYAIGALAMLMLADMSLHVPEWITGLTGMAFILLSLWSSIREKRRMAKSPS